MPVLSRLIQARESDMSDADAKAAAAKKEAEAIAAKKAAEAKK